MDSTLAILAHCLTRPVMSSGSGSHQTPVAPLELVMDSESVEALSGPILAVKDINESLAQLEELGWAIAHLFSAGDMC